MLFAMTYEVTPLQSKIKLYSVRALKRCLNGKNMIHGRVMATISKGPVKLIKRVKIAHSFLQSVPNQFRVIILSLLMYFYKWLSKNFSKPTSKNGDIGHFNL